MKLILILTYLIESVTMCDHGDGSVGFFVRVIAFFMGKQHSDLEKWRNGVLEREMNDQIAKKQSIIPSNPVHKENKVGRNDPCPCGSGKRYKKCCGK
jgi:uncharacterized protein YchJ